MWYKCKKAFLSWFGDILVLKSPMFLIFGDAHYKIRGRQTRNILKILKPGDVLLRHYDKYLSGFFIRGYYYHAAMYIGKEKAGGNEYECVVHAISEGVVKEDILSFTRCDGVAILRPKLTNQQESAEDATKNAVARAKKAVGLEYDMDYNRKTLDKLYCSQLVVYCYRKYENEFIVSERGLSKGKYVPEDFLKIDLFETVYDSRDDTDSPPETNMKQRVSEKEKEIKEDDERKK